MFSRKGLFATLACASAVLMSTPSTAQINPGFETCDASGWTPGGTGDFGATTGLNDFAPFEGTCFGYVAGGVVGVYTTISQLFTLAAGEKLNGVWGFQANDVYEDGGQIFNDDAFLRFNGIVQDSADVQEVGDFASTGWKKFSFTALSDGDYLLEIAVANNGDGDISSFAVLDAVHIIPSAGPVVPEPATWAMMIAGFGLAGAALRRRERSPLAA